MSPINPQALYVVEPEAMRFSRLLAETARRAVRLYWELFIVLPVQIFMIGMAMICLGVGVLDIAKNSSNICADLILICASAAILLFERVRTFFWAFLACCTLWWILVLAILIPLVGKDYRPASTAANVAIILLDILPPLAAAAFIDYARHRNTNL